MRYSLLSRFQAVLLGMELGEALGIDSQAQRSTPAAARLGYPQFDSLGLRSNWPPQPCFSLTQPSPEPVFPGTVSPEPATLGTTIVAQVSQNLIRSGGRVEQSPIQLLSPGLTDDWLLATLPIALFFHDDAAKLHQVLAQTASPENLGAGLAVCYAIAQALREQLRPKDLIPQTIAVLEQSVTPTAALTDLLKLLEQVQVGLWQNVGLATIAATLKSSAFPTHRTVAIALYCFLSTPEAWSLSVVRAVRVADRAPIAGALTGAIAGAYNSTIGLPLAWNRVAASSAMGSESALKLEQVAGRLWTVWSGALDPDASILGSEAIAAPNVIRI